MTDFESLLDYRRAVADLYAAARDQSQPIAARWQQFRQARDALFMQHPMSALSPAQQANFRGLSYFDYDPALRFVVPIEHDVEPDTRELALEHDGVVRLQRFGRVHFSVGDQTGALSLFWILGYGGGVFLPFRDATSGTETYGGGRYLLDTIKHADLGSEDGLLVLDFNFAYNPSCAYNSRWHCPLAPAESRLPFAIRAGERVPREYYEC